MSTVLRLLAFSALAGALFLSSSGPATADETIAMGDNWYCADTFANGTCTTTIDAGETVTWDFTGTANPHSVTDCGADCGSPTSSPAFDSGIIQGGQGPFSETFDQAGTFRYLCTVHGAAVMQGEIVVQAAQAATATPGASPTAGGAPTATTAPSGVPVTGAGPGGESTSWWLLTGVAAAAAALLGLGAVAYRRPR